MATHVLRRPTAVYRVADLQELPILASGHANADLAQLRGDARLRATADEIHRALDVRREDDIRRGSPTSVGDSLDSDSSGSGRRKRATDSPLRKKSRRRTASFARSLLPTERASFDACLRDVLTHRGLNEDHLPLLNRTAKCAVARNASSAGARRELHALVCNGEKLSVVRSLSACAAAGLAPRFWNCDTEPEGLVEAVQVHAPFVMRGRARRDDAFGSAMRALGDEATLRKVAPSSIVDVREHSVQLRDGGRLYAPSSRSMRCEEALAQRDRHIVTASCDALGEAASALSRTAPDFHLGSPTSTVLQLYPADGAEPPSRTLREVVVVCCAGSFALRCAPPSSARELPLSAGDALRVDVERDADALAPLDGAQHGVDFHVDAGDVIYIPAGYYRGLRAKDASTLLVYGFAPSPRKGRDNDEEEISSPAPHPEDLLDESSSSELGV